MSPDPRAQPARPDYAGAWVGAVLPALLGRSDRTVLPGPARDARSVVLLVLDGLGWRALEQYRCHLPNLAGMAGGPVPTTVPTTTSAGLTSISTGLPPAQHGVLGFRMRVGGEVLNVLQWRTGGGGDGPDPASVQPHLPFGGRALPLVTRAEFRGTGFSQAHLRAGRFVGWRTTAVLVEHCRRLVAAGERVVYAYYDGVDKVAHEYGLRNGFFEQEVVDTDRMVGRLLDVLPPDCALVVTADHGQVHVGAAGMLRLDAVAGMVAAYAGEARFRSLYARPGASGDLHAAAVDAYGRQAWVFSRDELFDGGWFGSGGSLGVRGRVGDVVLAARDPVGFVAPDYEQEAELVACHGSLTPDELLVPLVAARGRA